MDENSHLQLAPRIALVHTAIAQAAQKAGRATDAVTLLAISKTRPIEAIGPFINLGHRHFGENRVQEAAQKWPALQQAHADIQLHLVGALQSNKAEQASALFDVIHTLDRVKLADALARAGQSLGRLPRLFIQVNTGEEPQKSGVLPDQLDAFVAQCRTLFDLPLDGLMCLPPVDQAPGPHFALLGRLAARNGLSQLSMGMSDDFETAVQLGATHIRLGRQLFGPRD